MASQYATHPYHMDDFGGRHYPPQPRGPHPSTGRPRRPRYDGTPSREGTWPVSHTSEYNTYSKPERYPRRSHTYRAPPSPPSPSPSPSSTSPPPRRHPPRRSPRNHERSFPEEEDYYAPRRRQHRQEPQEDHVSGDLHDRRNPYRESRRDRDPPRRRDRDEGRRSTRPQPERKQSKWQKEGKKLFEEYAIPAIKAEGTKYISKQIGNILAKRASS